MQAGDFSIWVHYGPQALLAATILGTPPPELKNVFARENELIHQKFAGELAAFNGDASSSTARTALPAEVPARTDRAAAAQAVAMVGGCAGGGADRAHRARDSSPIAGTAAGMTTSRGCEANPESCSPAPAGIGDSYAVSGMRDPLAADPAQLAPAFGIAPAASWRPTLNRTNRWTIASCASASSIP